MLTQNKHGLKFNSPSPLSESNLYHLYLLSDWDGVGGAREGDDVQTQTSRPVTLPPKNLLHARPARCHSRISTVNTVHLQPIVYSV